MELQYIFVAHPLTTDASVHPPSPQTWNPEA